MTAATSLYDVPPTVSTPRDLGELAVLNHADLVTLYRDASVPRIADVRGDLRGRMLCVPSLEKGPLDSPIRAFAAATSFPWRGKSFMPRDPAHGEGINRVFTDRLRLFRFTTEVGPSRAGSFDAVQLDYDHDENPFFIRAIKDEIREVRAGLWLGQAYLLLGGRAHLGLWFALQK